MKKLKFNLIIALLLVIPFVLTAQTYKLTSGSNGMAASAHPLASQAAIDMLQKGGNAVDAAVAAAFAIGVVEPDGSGIGGGGSMVIYLKDKKKSFYINYYAKSPGNAPVNFNSKKQRHTAESICVPGTVAGLTLAHKKFGSLPLSTILEPAIHYAEKGFKIDATLASLILDRAEAIMSDSVTVSVFMDDGFPKMEGDLLVQKDLAKTLKEISKKGAKGFYKGKVAESIAEEIQKRGGYLSLNDLKRYKATISSPMHGSYRGYEVLSSGIPQSGISLVEGLNILENVDLKKMGHYSENSKTLHIMAETFRKIYTDRNYFMADPEFFKVPVNGLTSKAYAKERFNAINQLKPEPKRYRDTEKGMPYKYENIEKKKSGSKKHSGSDETKDVEDKGSTTHLNVVDKDGNAVSLTQTLGTFFGSAQTINGVLFNCAMTNFSSLKKSPNKIENNKFPRSTITPTIILKDNKPYLVIGSPGGSRIISTVLQVIVNVLDYEMNVEEANRAPRFYTQRFVDYLHLESGIDKKVIEELKEMGHPVRVYQGADLFFGGVQMILIDQKTGKYYGSADIRRGGKAIGY
ncbi:MAG: gamma-glutamyltransferase [Bacteroidota bacterium]